MEGITQDLPGIHCLVKLTVNEDFLALIVQLFKLIHELKSLFKQLLPVTFHY